MQEPLPIIQSAEDPVLAARFGDDAIVVAPHRRAAPPERFDPLRTPVGGDPLAPRVEPDKLRRAVGSDAENLDRLRVGVEQKGTRFRIVDFGLRICFLVSVSRIGVILVIF